LTPEDEHKIQKQDANNMSGSEFESNYYRIESSLKRAGSDVYRIES
jgi:hypothetical protein